MELHTNALEELLYSSTSNFSNLKNNKLILPHRYSYGMYLSINHNCSYNKIVSQYDRIYRIVFSTLTNKVLIPSEIVTKSSTPQKKLVTKLLGRNIPIMTSSISKFSYRKNRPDGRVEEGFYHHSHHHFYKVHNLMPNNKVEMMDKINELKDHLQKYIPTTNKKHCLIKIQPCGTGSNIDDRIDEKSYYDYLNTDPYGAKKNLLTYFRTQSPVQCDTSLRFTYVN